METKCRSKELFNKKLLNIHTVLSLRMKSNLLTLRSAYTLIFVEVCEDEHLRECTVSIRPLISNLAPGTVEGQ